MAFVSVTRLRIRSLRYIPLFMIYTLKTALQAKRAPGNLGVRLRKTKGLTFWTLTSWHDQQVMSAYRATNPHRNVMPKLKLWCDEASVVNWSQETSVLPNWDYAVTQMLKSGRLSTVDNPSNVQASGQINVT
ncbi:hypothetical protein [Vreelandella populi]|uniref:DUF3291 domain-containing protein n=1 Tax=Vreelandella populi TaxID=2498858 RepID=A0A3S0YC66_9GAMM|nr:hypothetical protein [Halomonas populi]RUR39103.1 hypothetical protein ELY25_05500 [Halomonas populi]RUR46163.1 hypothetical protein ELY37_09235 [Halomonas populi]